MSTSSGGSPAPRYAHVGQRTVRSSHESSHASLEVLNSGNASHSQQRPSKPSTAPASRPGLATCTGHSEQVEEEQPSPSSVHSQNSTRGSSANAAHATHSRLLRGILVDVVTSRRMNESQGSREEDAKSESRSVATTLRSVASMSAASLARAEKELSKILPLDENGACVLLSRSDIERIHDPETLRFLRDNAATFIKYFGRSNRNTPANLLPPDVAPSVVAAGAPQSKVVHSASDIEKAVLDLANDINTFITAVDSEGGSYRIPVESDGTLYVPVETGDPLDDGCDENDAIRVATAQSVNSSQLLDDEELRVLQEEEEEARQALLEDGDEVVMGSNRACDDDSKIRGQAEREEAMQEEERRLAPSEQDSVLLGSLTGDAAPEHHGTSQLPKRETRDTLRIAVERKRERKGGKPSFMGQTKATAARSKPGRREAMLEGLRPQPAADNKATPEGDVGQKPTFNVTKCSAPLGHQRETQARPPALDGAMRPMLTPAQEQRVAFILEHEDWDTCAQFSAPSSDAELPHGDEDEVVRRSGTYAAASGFGHEPATQQRLKEIDAQLEAMARARCNATSESEAEARCLMTKLLGQEDRNAVDSDGSIIHECIEAPANVSQAASATSESRATSQLKTTQEEANAAAAAKHERMKRLGNGYVEELRRDRVARERLTGLNERLERLHSDLDNLVTPPFVFNQQYEMQADPSAWKWPPELPAPSENEIQKLLLDARRETAFLLTGSDAGDDAAPPAPPPICHLPSGLADEHLELEDKDESESVEPDVQ